LPPALIVAALVTWFLHGETWSLDDIKLAIGTFLISLAICHLAMAAMFSALQRESRIAALLRYYGDTTADQDMAIIE
jgi:hypothetical protein